MNELALILNFLLGRLGVILLAFTHFPIYFISLTAERIRRRDNPDIIFLLKMLLIGFPLLLGLILPSYFLELPAVYFAVIFFCLGMPLGLAVSYLSLAFVTTMAVSFVYSFYQGLLYGTAAYRAALVTIDIHLRTIAERQWFEDIDEFRAFLVLFKAPQNQPNLRHFELKPSERTPNLLLDTELSCAKTLISNWSQQNLRPEQTQQIATLKVKCEQYENLLSRLAVVNQVLNNESSIELEDELIVFCSVENPIFFVKQYQKNDHWYSVPADGKITDKSNLSQWLKKSNMHPLNKDCILEPEEFQDCPTRYRWHGLSKNYCYTEGLSECAEEIRELVKVLSLVQAAESAPKPSNLAALSFYKPQDVQNPIVTSATQSIPDL